MCEDKVPYQVPELKGKYKGQLFSVTPLTPHILYVTSGVVFCVLVNSLVVITLLCQEVNGQAAFYCLRLVG